MTVFKGYMKIIGQNRMLILLYVAIFFGCTLLFQSTAMCAVILAVSFVVVRRERYDSI